MKVYVHNGSRKYLAESGPFQWEAQGDCTWKRKSKNIELKWYHGHSVFEAEKAESVSIYTVKL